LIGATIERAGMAMAAVPTKQDIDILGGPDRTRTCNQTVMSGRIAISFVDFAAFSFDLDRVRCASFTPFLVRNWCGCPAAMVRPVRSGICPVMKLARPTLQLASAQ
jgi:hypothetical protein